MTLRLPHLRERWVTWATILALMVGWEIAARLSPKTVLALTPLVPSFEQIFGRSLLGMADYWKFPFRAPITSMGGSCGSPRVNC